MNEGKPPKITRFECYWHPCRRSQKDNSRMPDGHQIKVTPRNQTGIH